MTINQFWRTYDRQISEKIRDALAEDLVSKDVTSSLLFSGNSREITTNLICKQNCILAGLSIFKRVFREVNHNISFKAFYSDSDLVGANNRVLEISGPAYDILRAERTSLNFIQRMSGIATLTSKFVQRLKYKNSKILHTRKTTPNFRLFEVAAVKLGGGDFHRLTLGSAILIKDNHIKTAGSLKIVLKKLQLQKKKHIVEVEVQSVAQLENVLALGKDTVHIVMLDNFPPARIPETLRLLEKSGIKVELSGGINQKNFGKRQFPGIDFYSIGMLTHSYKSINFSLDF